MVSAGVCFGGKGIMQLIPGKVKVNGKLWNRILFMLQKSVSSFGFIFQQDIELIMPLQFPFTTVNMAKQLYRIAQKN